MDTDSIATGSGWVRIQFFTSLDSIRALRAVVVPTAVRAEHGAALALNGLIGLGAAAIADHLLRLFLDVRFEFCHGFVSLLEESVRLVLPTRRSSICSSIVDPQ